jgi:hypothetical protein
MIILFGEAKSGSYTTGREVLSNFVKASEAET